jgi:hypothetical protein
MGQTLAVAGQRITASLLNRMYGQADANAHQVTQASLTDLSTVYVIPANDAAVGTAYRITCYGQGTWGSTQQQLNMQITLGSSTSLGQANIPSTALAASTSFRWYAVMNFVVATTGSSGSAIGGLDGHIYATGATGTAGRAIACAGAVTMNTTVANNFRLQASWGSTTGTPTLTCLATIFERVN